MTIQYASDLHLEFADNREFVERGGLTPIGDILVLAGDVSYLGDHKMMKRPFFDWCAEEVDRINEMYPYLPDDE